MALAVGLLDSFSGFIAGLLLGGGGLVLVLLGFTFWMDASSTRKGWEGEQRVALELSYLNDEFLLLNDVMLPRGRGNIDHILVGPTGVFVFETKNYSGKYVCYGDRRFFQGVGQKYDVSSVSVQAKNNANALASLLHTAGFTVDVNPVIVFTHPSVQPNASSPHCSDSEERHSLQLLAEPTAKIPALWTIFSEGGRKDTDERPNEASRR